MNVDIDANMNYHLNDQNVHLDIHKNVNQVHLKEQNVHLDIHKNFNQVHLNVHINVHMNVHMNVPTSIYLSSLSMNKHN